MSISITLFSRGAAATRLLGRGVVGWTVAAAVGAGSGYYAGSAGHAAAARPAAVAATAALPASDLQTETPDAAARAEPLPPTF